MAKFGSNSWQAREALADRKAFKTYGSFKATGPEALPWGNRLPADWRERYERQYDEITYVVWSYDTPIAWVLEDGSVIKVNHKWSVTTSKHQGMLYALTASTETRNGIFDAAARERQSQRNKRAEARESW